MFEETGLPEKGALVIAVSCAGSGVVRRGQIAMIDSRLLP